MFVFYVNFENKKYKQIYKTHSILISSINLYDQALIRIEHNFADSMMKQLIYISSEKKINKRLNYNIYDRYV